MAAINATTGDVIWMREILHHLDPTGPTATIFPVVAGGVVVAGSRDGPVYAFDRTTGEQRWKLAPFPFPLVTDPTLIRDIHYLAACDEVVYVGSTSTLVAALDARTGQELWRSNRHPSATADRPSCDSRSVYVMRPLGGLEALDARTGARRWGIGYPDNDFWVGVVADGDHVYGGGLLGLYALRND